MSTKTIAVESSVYERLAREKRESESFTKVIARLLNTSAEAHTGHHIADAVTGFEPLPEKDADQFLKIVAENRGSETWGTHDLR